MTLKDNKSIKLHTIMAFTGNAIFGFSFLFSKLALDIAEPLVLIAVRFLVAFFILTVLRFSGLMPCHFKGKNILPLLLLGLFQPVIYFICESYGIKFTSSSFAGILIALIPIAGLILGAIILKEKPTILQIIFSVLSVSGVIVMTVTDQVGTFEWKGFLILLGAVFSGAMFSIQSRKVASDFTAFERTYIMFFMGAILFTALALFTARKDFSIITKPLSSGKFWISILYLSVVSSIGAFMLLNKALDVLDVTRSLVFANITTVISVLAGVFILKEHFSFIQAIGIVMAIIGVYGVNRFVRKSVE